MCLVVEWLLCYFFQYFTSRYKSALLNITTLAYDEKTFMDGLGDVVREG